MAKRITIPDLNFNDGSTCTSYYAIRIKRIDAINWSVLLNQFSSPIIIDNLEEDVEYNIEITRYCCEGTNSAPVTINILTTQLDPVTSFVATPTGSDIVLTWDNDTDVTTYKIDRATNSIFTTGLSEIYSGAYTSAVTDTGVVSTTHYYYRIRGYAPPLVPTEYAYSNAIAP